jgi:alpha-glucosidase
VVDSVEAVLPEGAWPNYVLGNHDESRLASRYRRDEARVAAMLLLTLRGTPTLYYGDEIGMTDGAVPPERKQDPWAERVPGMGRDPCRTPMQWSAAPNAGFSPPDTPELWLPLPDDFESVNVERQLAEPRSMLNLYRRLLAHRRATPALQWGSYRPLDDVPDACYVFLRQTKEEQNLVALNFSDQKQRLTIPGLEEAIIVVSTHLDRSGAVNPGALSLRGNEGVIVELARS